MFVKCIYRHSVYNKDRYKVCKFRIYKHFLKFVNGSNSPVIINQNNSQYWRRIKTAVSSSRIVLSCLVYLYNVNGVFSAL